MTYAIYEGNMERLEKKLRTVENKCAKYGCEFHYEKIGEEYREVKDDDTGEIYTAKFILVEASGTAQMSGWKFAATIDHTEKGNIISSVGGMEIPEKYYNSELYCEHCKTRHHRKHVYIVYNEELNEFKQVGTKCLKDFVYGMDAEHIAAYLSWFDKLIEAESVGGGSGYGTRYYPAKELLCYMAETIRHFGYERSNGWGTGTGARAFRYYRVDKGMGVGGDKKFLEECRREMEQVNFNGESEEAAKNVDEALEWLEAQEESNNYMHNLKVAASLEWVDSSKFNLLASLFPTYDRELEREAERRERERKAFEEGERSKWVGAVDKRIKFKTERIDVITSWSTMFGTTWVWKLFDEDGNIYTWKTSNCLDVDCKYEVVGTVKEHKEYRGVKQTELTRCRTTMM